ncbi:MAG TPA: hypothetical protein VN154_06880 [Rhizomicrobium sp.]|nr:hypothetical protein [Rhizomicrobium sp.]
MFFTVCCEVIVTLGPVCIPWLAMPKRPRTPPEPAPQTYQDRLEDESEAQTGSILSSVERFVRKAAAPKR